MHEQSLDGVERAYAMMLRIRIFEERVADLVTAGEVTCPCHLYIGQEGIAVGVCTALRTDDYVFGTHRSHGHYLAKGGSMREMMAEILGKVTGCSRGRGGSMHLIAPEVGLLGTVPLVGATISLAVGAALAAKLKGEDRVAVTFFGDGAVEEGTFHESMNLAAAYKLPVLFVCENNLYSSHLSLLERRAQDNIVMAAAAHGMPGVQDDGNDFFRVYRVAGKAVERARAGEGPSLLELRTYRWRGHVGPSWDTDVGVKRTDELGEWLKKDPIARLRDYLLANRIAVTRFEEIEREVRREVEGAVVFARESPYPPREDATTHVFKETAPTELG